MRIAVSATGPSLVAEVDPRFGRCQYFVIVDPDTMEFETLSNPNVMAAGGAGISTAQMIAGKGVQVVLTRNCGPNAYQALSQAGIQVITGLWERFRMPSRDLSLGSFKLPHSPASVLTSEWEVVWGWAEAWVVVWVEEWDEVWAWVPVWDGV
ncbi:MAG: NifB/NifX family molybdenum-iron cluster-binding protein [Dehalococcoidales bacterium]|nr:NifB/NifX family molybdenum-iron cluster-binding protein [Dehalococcoidales bacterium]